MMTIKKYLPQFTIAALFALTGLAHAADEPSVSLDRPGTGVKEFKVGDAIPDEYQRERLGLKDWKKRHLKAPGEHEQWVEIKDKYVLVSIPTGTAKEMVDKRNAGK
jgi:Ni/Co efflux regulator RcnB